MSTTYGTENQNRYLNMLRGTVGEDAVANATRKVLGLDPGAALPDSVSVEQTSAILGLLKDIASKATGRLDSRVGQGHSAGATKRLTGLELLALADLGTAVPTDLDQAMHKVVMRLRRLNALREVAMNPDAPVALNGKEPILVAVFVSILGGQAEAAKALGVTMKTLEGWGEYLPDSHESRAELVTKGAVRARLPG
ncbi:hypothetical protein H8Z72_22720 (plasmid) [Xanthomonas citri pv. citri]|uniref:Cro/CI family transcriptional regulator n=1 Tax=Xanthomonas citri TaxID=346 RepID=UPI001933850D|nr:Cro/CI family transcriptional regulator [Xanthomonas citri]QRD62656.1 hypothetical protein H8Z74_23465 [Xanthomonas citri pv. citri]QRD67191.1 hypothetical protein H8Z73_22445 [Xanthomonas citri pv. citri]QRD71764.1 hypothetical protein H8Z72_22720 [Xanthomonas citri pv. citri]